MNYLSARASLGEIIIFILTSSTKLVCGERSVLILYELLYNMNYFTTEWESNRRPSCLQSHACGSAPRQSQKPLSEIHHAFSMSIKLVSSSCTIRIIEYKGYFSSLRIMYVMLLTRKTSQTSKIRLARAILSEEV